MGRRISEFFGPEGKIMAFGGLLFDLFITNVLWIVFSGTALFVLLVFLIGQTAVSAVGPFVTYPVMALTLFLWGPATAAMNETLAARMVKKDRYLLRDYFTNYKKHFLRHYLLSAIASMVFLLLAYNIYLLNSYPEVFGGLGHVFTVFQIVLMTELLLVAVHLFAVQTRTEVTMKEQIRLSFILANKHLVSTFFCALLFAAAASLLYYTNLALIFFVVSPTAYLILKQLGKTYDRYWPDEDDD